MPRTSILTSTKKLLGIDESNKDFDVDLVLHINSVFMILNQLGIGPETPFDINDESQKWDYFIGTEKGLEALKTYMYMKVRIVFDPPQVGTLFEAFERQIKEYEWRLLVQAEDLKKKENEDG